jgi:hypothetical protein
MQFHHKAIGCDHPQDKAESQENFQKGQKTPQDTVVLEPSHPAFRSDIAPNLFSRSIAGLSGY